MLFRCREISLDNMNVFIGQGGIGLRRIFLAFFVLSMLSCGGDLHKKNAPSLYRQDEIIVKFRSQVKEMQKSAAHTMLGVRSVRKIGSEGFERIKLPGGISPEKAIEIYQANPDVEYAEPNYIVRISAIPDDTLFMELWGFHNTGQAVNGVAGSVDADIDVPEAWDILNSASSVIVAVIDTGVDGNHPDISGNLIAGHDFVNNDSDPGDLNGHGTHVAGTIGAVGNNATGVAGVNWHVKIMPLRVLDQNGEGTIADIIEAIEYAAGNNARIINMSFAGPDFSQALYNKIASYPDILFVAAAGNGGEDGIGDNSDSTPEYPAGFNLSNIISVAATDQNDDLSVFSNFGPLSIDVAAPGTNILSVYPSFVTGLTYGGIYKVVYLSFGFEGINGIAARNAVMQRVLNFNGVTHDNSILVVDDDGGNFYESYFTQALQALGYAFDYHAIPPTGDGPSVAQLRPYTLVVWFTGNEFGNTLTLIDQSNLQSYLDSGGGLFLTGQEIGFDIGTTIFYRNYLHAEYITDDAGGTLYTGLNDFSGLSVELPLTFGDGAKNQNFIDAVNPLGSAAAFSLHYDDAYHFLPGTSMAAAMVSGVAALVASHYNNFNAAQIKGTILGSVDVKSSLQGKVLSGGRLNAHRALTSLMPPSGLTAAAQSATKVSLTWNDNSSGENGFRIERKKAGDQFVEIASVAGDLTTYSDNGADPGTMYAYRVRAFNAVAASSYSNEASVTLPAGTKSKGGGGGGGCSVGTVSNCHTAFADTIILLLPLVGILVLRRFSK
jgi:subtilisin family serine protease